MTLAKGRQYPRTHAVKAMGQRMQSTGTVARLILSVTHDS